MTTIAPNDANLVYSPYNWLVSAGSAKTICSGAYLRAMFTGTPGTLTIGFDVTNMVTPTTRVAYRIDGGPWVDTVVAASVACSLSSLNTTWGTHTFELLMVASTETQNRWNSPQGTALVFTGLTADVTVTTKAYRKRPLTGLLFGDSITEGVRVNNSTATNDTDRNDARLSWALPLGDRIGAEVGVVGFGGVGITKTGSGNVPAFYNSLPYLWNGQARDLTTVAPDFVIGHIGTNDSSATDTDVTNYTTQLLNYLLGKVPATSPILILPGWRQYKAAAIQAGINNSSAPKRVTYVDTTGWWATADSSDSTHPYGYINIGDLSSRVAASLRSQLKPAPQFYRRDANGNAVGVY